MEKHTIIFDFDGTIADTLDTVIDIYNSIAPLFFCTRVDKKDKALLQTKSLQDFFRLYGVGRFKLPLVLLCIRIQLHRQLHRIHPIEGIVEALHAIKSAGFRLGIVTSNSEQNVREFLQTHVLSGVFDFVYGEKNIFGKDIVMKKVLHREHISQDAVIYVGDETRDIEMSKKLHIPIVAVAWGFNAGKTLASLDPDALVHAPKDLLKSFQKIFDR